MTVGPVSPVPREARPYQGQPAGLVTRGLASTVDGLVVAAVLLGCYLGLNGFLFLLDPRGFEFTGASVVLSLAAGSVVLVAYFTVAWSTTGRTYGCHVMGLRVLDRRHERLRVHLALVRAVLCTYLPVGLLWCAVNRSHHSAQDIVLRTVVVYDWQPRAPRSSPRSSP